MNDPRYAATVLDQLAQMYRDGSRTDLTVVVGDRRFEVHGCMLMCGSEFFQTQLQTAVGNASMREMELPAMSARAFELIVECVYTGVLRSIDDSNVMELLEASQRLQVGAAEAQCCEWLEEHLDASSALVMWESATRLGCAKIREMAWLAVARHLGDVARQEAFLALPQSQLVELVSGDSLAVHSEVVVYEAVMGWVRSDIATRTAALGEVLGAVRLGLLPLKYLVETVEPDPLIKANLEASRLLNEAFSSQIASSLGNGGANPLAAVRSKLLRRRNRNPEAGLVVVGGGTAVGSEEVSVPSLAAEPCCSIARLG